MATQMFFALSKSPLYGIFHPAVDAKKSVLILNSIGYEYMRSHRAIKSMAQQFSRKGIHSLRFDYRGTGHSSDNLENITLDTLLEDCNYAIDELIKLSNHNSVHIVALRFGALLALLAGQADNANRISSITLWDPIIHGHQLFDEMNQAATALDDEKDPYLSNRSREHSLPDTQAYLGYVFSNTLVQSIENISIDTLLDIPTRLSVFLGGSHETPAPLKREGVTVQRVAAPDAWCEIDNFGSVLLPQEMIQAIVRQVATNA